MVVPHHKYRSPQGLAVEYRRLVGCCLPAALVVPDPDFACRHGAGDYDARLVGQRTDGRLMHLLYASD